MLQYRFEMERLFDVPPGAFNPAPKVDVGHRALIPRPYDDKISLALPDALEGRDPRQIKTNDLLMKWGSYDLPPGGVVGMHSTRTVDLLTMLEGELTMVLDSGEVVVLKPHDTLLQRGVVHAWQNRSDKPARWTVVTLGRLKD
jgi:hypothetical protein